MTKRDEMKKTDFLTQYHISMIVAQVLFNIFLVEENKKKLESLITVSNCVGDNYPFMSVFVASMFTELIEEYLNTEIPEIDYEDDYSEEEEGDCL